MASRVCWGSTTTLQPPGVTMHRPPALYDIRHLLKTQLPDLPGHLRAVLALWVEGTLLALNGCQDAVTLALAHRPRGPANPHTLRRLQRELLYNDADRIESWGLGQELAVADCFAPLLQWVRSWWVPTEGRKLAQEPLVRALDPTSKHDELVALVISVVYRQHALPIAWHIVEAQAQGSWIDHFCRLLRLLAPAVPATVPVHVLCDQGLGKSPPVGPDCGLRLASVLALRTADYVSTAGPEPARSGALVDHGTGRPVGGHRPGLPRGASGQHFDCIASLRSGAALGAADRHAGGADGAHPVCLPQLD